MCGGGGGGGLKALCNNIRCNCFFNELISSKIGYRKYGHAQYRGIVYRSIQRSNTCSAKILLMIELRSSRSSAMGSQRVRIYWLISKGYRAHAMLETLNSLQREPQWADLNTRHELISRLPCPLFIWCMGMCGFISR